MGELHDDSHLISNNCSDDINSKGNFDNKRYVVFWIKIYSSEIPGKFYGSCKMLFQTSLDILGKSESEFYCFSLNI